MVNIAEILREAGSNHNKAWSPVHGYLKVVSILDDKIIFTDDLGNRVTYTAYGYLYEGVGAPCLYPCCTAWNTTRDPQPSWLDVRNKWCGLPESIDDVKWEEVKSDILDPVNRFACAIHACRLYKRAGKKLTKQIKEDIKDLAEEMNELLEDLYAVE